MGEVGESSGANCVGREFRDFRIVMPQHLNQYGALFGGYLLQVIDELAFVACVRTFPGHNFLTRALQNVEFHAPAHLGDMLECVAVLERTGRTSAHVRVQVFVAESQRGARRMSFDGLVVLVCVDGEGKAMTLPAPGGGEDVSDSKDA